jgi:hypothetical protein
MNNTFILFKIFKYQFKYSFCALDKGKKTTAIFKVYSLFRLLFYN